MVSNLTTDRLIGFLDTGLRTLFNNPSTTERENPASTIVKSDANKSKDLTEKEQKHIAALMRINHCGEVCAQGLYQGQSLTARSEEVREKMEISAKEENDHLSWTAERINELGSHTSYLNPLFYLGSLTLGTVAGLLGDKWSLGFVAETEKQVVKHLDSHLKQIPERDQKSIQILKTMKQDELRHATKALESGGAELPVVVKRLMGLSSKAMTKSTYWV